MAPMLALALAAALLVTAPPSPGDPNATPDAGPSAIAPPPPAPAPAPAPPAAPAPAAQADEAEAPRAYVVERVELVGLQKARPHAVRRHLLVHAGDVLDDDDVLLSRLRLLQLGWFARVEGRIDRGSERGLVVVVFTVVERNTILVTDL